MSSTVKGYAALTPAQKESVAHAVAARNAELGPPQGAFAGTDGDKAIKFALDEIDDHYEREDFLRGWLEGDTREWPEFKPAILNPPLGAGQ